jgi:DNA-binding XRE family transcriptional regulator
MVPFPPACFFQGSICQSVPVRCTGEKTSMEYEYDDLAYCEDVYDDRSWQRGGGGKARRPHVISVRDPADAVREARTMKQISQEELSRLCGIDSGNICKIERGQRVPRYKTLEKIASALDLSMEITLIPKHME